MRYGRVAAVTLLAAGCAAALPMSQASAQCWYNGWGWRCGPGPGLLALPFIAAGTALAVATAPVRAVVGGPYYYGPPPAYYGPVPAYYAPPDYYAPRGYYFGPPSPPNDH